MPAFRHPGPIGTLVLALLLFLTEPTASGWQMAWAASPIRILSLAPSLTETLYALGAQDEVVGVSNYTDFPPAARAKPDLGGPYTLDLEQAMALHPTLILTVDGTQQAYRRLADLTHARLVVLPSARVSQVFANILTLARLTGRVEAGRRLVTRLRSELSAIRPVAGRPTVFYMVWPAPLMTAGPGSYLDDLISMAGGRNIADGLHGAAPYPTYSWELLVAQDPDVIVAPANLAGSLASLARDRPYLEAVRNHELITVDADVISRPGPRLPLALRLIRNAIRGVAPPFAHPGASRDASHPGGRHQSQVSVEPSR